MSDAERRADRERVHEDRLDRQHDRAGHQPQHRERQRHEQARRRAAGSSRSRPAGRRTPRRRRRRAAGTAPAGRGSPRRAPGPRRPSGSPATATSTCQVASSSARGSATVRTPASASSPAAYSRRRRPRSAAEASSAIVTGLVSWPPKSRASVSATVRELSLLRDHGRVDRRPDRPQRRERDGEHQQPGDDGDRSGRRMTACASRYQAPCSGGRSGAAPARRRASRPRARTARGDDERGQPGDERDDGARRSPSTAGS